MGFHVLGENADGLHLVAAAREQRRVLERPWTESAAEDDARDTEPEQRSTADGKAARNRVEMFYPTATARY